MIGAMIILFFIFMYFSVLSLCGGACTCSNGRFECANITQDEFRLHIFKQRNCFNEKSEYIISISNSDDFAVIEEFPDLQKLINFKSSYIKTLIIRNSSVRHISDDAFLSLNSLQKIDLSENLLTNFTFVKTLPNGVTEIILHDNKIEVFDLNLIPLSPNTYTQSQLTVDLSKNEIFSILPKEKNYYNFHLYSLDLSYNKLRDFKETNTNCGFNSLNLNYNQITNIEINNNKNLFTILGNNITSITFNEVHISNFYLDFIPRSTLPSLSSVSIANSTLINLNNENKLKNRNGNSWINIDLSNASLLRISENYFRNMIIRSLKLNNNDFKVLNQSIFSGAALNNLDLSNCGIQIITKEIFNGLNNNYYDHRFRTLNLSRNLIDYFGDICSKLLTLESLDLSLNKFTNISFFTFNKCSSLQLLDISKNRIRIIENRTFSNLNYLKNIDLSNNEIDNIEEFGFSNLSTLETINLSNNKLKILENRIFKDLPVSNIYLQGNEIRYIKSKAFDTLQNLRMLNLSRTTLSTLENDSFYNLRLIETIDLSNNYLYILDNATFRNLPLYNLDLSGNTLEKIRSVVFENLSNLRNLNLSNLRINNLEPFAFVNLQNLEFIDLRNNNITGIQPNVFKKIQVENIFLDKITEPIHLDNTVVITNLSLQFTGVFQKATVSNVYLKYLHFFDSRIELMKNNCLLGNYGLEKLVFVNSSVSELEPKAFSGLFSLTELDLSPIFKNTATLQANTLEDLNNLWLLKISGTELNEIKVGSFFGLNKLLELHLNKNKLTSINEEAFASLNSTLFSLDLSENFISSLNLVALGNSLQNLKILNVSSSSILRLIGSNNIFRSNLIEVLDLSNNIIDTLYSDIFKTFLNLNTLYLNNNILRTINYQSFNHLTNLKILRLDNNKLGRFPFGIFDGLTKLSSLNISKNSIYCYNSDMYQYINTLFSLENLEYLYLDNICLNDHFQFDELKSLFVNLRRVTVNNNHFNCYILSKLLQYFKRYGIDYSPYNPNYYVQNIDGITCTTR